LIKKKEGKYFDLSSPDDSNHLYNINITINEVQVKGKSCILRTDTGIDKQSFMMKYKLYLDFHSEQLAHQR
jgi:hypothetical protein